MSSEQRSSIGFSICLVFGILLSYSLCLTSLIIAYNYSDENCIKDYAGISFSYTTWLKVNGFIGTAYTFILISLISVLTYQKLEINDILSIVKISYVPYFIFGFVWYIVGAVLYFETVHSCYSGLPIRSFGLALFIIQTIGMCNIGGTRSNDNADSVV